MRNKIESLTFWQTVKEEFAANSEEFLCYGSGAFQEVWNEGWALSTLSRSRVIITKLGKRFLKQINSEHEVSDLIGDIFNCPLFEIRESKEGRLVREQFINWNIEHFSRK
jgi:hypothetical protein